MEILLQIIFNSLIAASIYTLVALGFNLIYGATKFFNLAHGALIPVGGYAVFYFTKTLGVNVYISILLGVLVAGLVGYALDKLIYFPMRRRKATNMVKLVASLGAFTAIQALLAIQFGSQIQTLVNFIDSPIVYTLGGASFTHIQLIIFVLAILVSVSLILIINKTIFGKAVKAISDDEEVAKVIGINTNKILGYVFFVGSAIAGMAGVAVGFDIGIQPTMGLPLLLKGVIGAIVGGVGSLPGAILGSLFLGLTENFGAFALSGEWKDAIAFVLLIIFLIFRPRGIMNK